MPIRWAKIATALEREAAKGNAHATQALFKVLERVQVKEPETDLASLSRERRARILEHINALIDAEDAANEANP